MTRAGWNAKRQRLWLGPLLTTFGASLAAHEESLHCFFSFLFLQCLPPLRKTERDRERGKQNKKDLGKRKIVWLRLYSILIGSQLHRLLAVGAGLHVRHLRAGKEHPDLVCFVFVSDACVCVGWTWAVRFAAGNGPIALVVGFIDREKMLSASLLHIPRSCCCFFFFFVVVY